MSGPRLEIFPDRCSHVGKESFAPQSGARTLVSSSCLTLLRLLGVGRGYILCSFPCLELEHPTRFPATGKSAVGGRHSRGLWRQPQGAKPKRVQVRLDRRQKRSSPYIPFIAFNPVSLQELQKLFFKTDLPMASLLISDGPPL
jgi:hypothetical protein